MPNFPTLGPDKPRKRPGPQNPGARRQEVAAVTPPPAPTGIGANDLAAILAPLTDKQAAFIRAFLVNGRNASAAYRAAGFSTANNNTVKAGASKIVTRPSVQAAIATIDLLLAKSAVYDFETASKHLREDRADARSAGQFTAAVRASELLAKLHGHLTDKLDMRLQGDVAFILPPRGLPPVDPPTIQLERDNVE